MASSSSGLIIITYRTIVTGELADKLTTPTNLEMYSAQLQ